MFRSKSYLPLFVAIILMLGVVYLARPSTKVASPNIDLKDQATEQEINDLLGVVNDVASDETFFSVMLPDGGVEEIIVSEKQKVTKSEIGLLAQVSGVRDLASRRITASSVEILEDKNIYVTSPSSGSTVTSPLVVFGFGRVFEQIIDWRLRDADGDVVKEGFGITRAKDIGQFGPFRFDVFLPAVSGEEFTLEVFSIAPRDGSEQDLVSVPLNLLSDDTTRFQVYFYSDEESSDCSEVFPVSRVVSNTSAQARAALLELLAGPTEAESDSGFRTLVPKGLYLRSLAIVGGEARVDLSDDLKDIKSDCEKETAIEQIKETLLQFSGVKSIVISVDGEEN